MKKNNILLMSLLFVITSCSKCKNAYDMTADLKSVEPSCECNLYVEYYHTVFGLSTYLTDSLNFRKFTGTFDDEQGNIAFGCKGDSIIVEKSKRDPGYVMGSFVLEKRVIYSLKELKKNHSYD
jgi:hypothetical protein